MGYDPTIQNGVLKGPSRGIQTNYPNASGSTLAKGTVVSVNTSSQIATIDVSSETSVEALVGVVSVNIPNAAMGGVTSHGRLENIASGFAIGDAIYVGKTGVLTNVKPDVGTGGFLTGDFVIFVGVIVKNEFDSAKQDLQMMPQVVGQL